MTKRFVPVEIPFALNEMRCPRCHGTDMSVRQIYAHFAADEIIVAFDTDPMQVIELDGGGGETAWITLIVYCAGCDREMDLYLREGKIRVDHGDNDTARAIWGNLD